jgi:hypothetical protein
MSVPKENDKNDKNDKNKKTTRTRKQQEETVSPTIHTTVHHHSPLTSAN